MNALVVDASAILSFVLADEQAAASARVRTVLETRRDIHVPVHWWLEIGNALLMAEKRGHILTFEVTPALEFVSAFSITVDHQTASPCRDELLSIARKYALTIYDAAYLELAIRRHATLATSDKALARAARSAGVTMLS